MPKFRTGTDDFRELREDGGYFVDKSPLINEVIQGNKVTLLPRPRRFGKTLNMTMLRYFFERSEDDRSLLFNGLAITKDADNMAHQGKYPVIYLSLKDVKGNSWEVAFERLVDKIAQTVLRAKLDLSVLAPGDHEDMQALIHRSAGRAQLEASLAKLTELLFIKHDEPVVVLIDEYDSPIIEAWKNGYYDEMVSFMRNWLGGGLKPERGETLFRAVITGILRVAKESMFSGLNNLDVSNMLKSGPFADKFGFTQPEIDKILADFSLPGLAAPIQEWYNGYDFGGQVIYNPWSVIKCISEHPNPIGPQWLNTASNELVHHELEAGGLALKRDLEKLLAGDELRYPIQDSTTFSNLARNPETIWSFLFFSGYLTAVVPAEDPITGLLTYKLSIPNREVHRVYRDFVGRWHQTLSFDGTEQILRSLLAEDFQIVETLLNELVCNLVSCHDVAKYPEAAYHAFVLGLLANLRQIYTIRSNPESGYGRADIIMEPKSDDYPLAFVIEFKSISADGNLDTSATAALAQIEEKQYDAPLLEAGIKPEMIRKLAIVVSGKRVKVQQG